MHSSNFHIHLSSQIKIAFRPSRHRKEKKVEKKLLLKLGNSLLRATRNLYRFNSWVNHIATVNHLQKQKRCRRRY